jgi:hypothetical protein
MAMALAGPSLNPEDHCSTGDHSTIAQRNAINDEKLLVRMYHKEQTQHRAVVTDRINRLEGVSPTMRTLQLLSITLLCGILLAFAAQPVAAAERCFPETKQCIEGRFEQFWNENGGLAVFGLPTTERDFERSADTGDRYWTQWFERNRFEYHIENQRPYDVLLGRLGDDRLKQIGRDWQAEPRDAGAQPGCVWFEQTGRNVCDQANGIGFKTYWQTHGLEFDGQRGTSYAESLALFGLPLTAPQQETNASGDTVLTQWFERARFEWHPNNPDQFKVLLGLLGSEVRPPTQPLNVVAQGFGQDGIAVGVGFVVENPNANLAIENSEYQLAAYDASGTVLRTGSGYIHRLEPGQRLGIGDDLYLPDGATIARLDVQLQTGEARPSPKGAEPLIGISRKSPARSATTCRAISRASRSARSPTTRRAGSSAAATATSSLFRRTGRRRRKSGSISQDNRRGWNCGLR